jgi:hypothetical protein
MCCWSLSCHRASHCTAAACCHAAALQALTAEVSTLKEAKADQDAVTASLQALLAASEAQVATLEATALAVAADSESQMRKMQDAYEVSTGRELQLLLLWVCCNCRVLDSLQSRYVQISYCHAYARSHSAYLPHYRPIELCRTVYALIHTRCQVRPPQFARRSATIQCSQCCLPFCCPTGFLHVQASSSSMVLLFLSWR